MKKKSKISVRKVLRVFVTVVATSACVVAVLGASEVQSKKLLQKISLHIRNDKYQFLDKDAFWEDILESKGIVEGKTKMAELDIQSIENNALKNPWISQAEAYVDNKGELHIYVTQRLPAARMFYENGQSFYIDESLNLLPLSDFFTYYTAIVTNVPVFANDSLNKNLRAQIVKMVKYVEHDTFWSAQIAQISVTPDIKFELTPVLGTHKIQFGDTTDMHEKFCNLFAFYQKVLNRIGWNTYDNVDVRFKDQVIASPAVQWEPSIKNPISNMDWVKSIIDNDPEKNTRTKLVKAAKKKDEGKKKSNTIRTASVKKIRSNEN